MVSPPGDEFDQGTDLMARRDLREPRLPRQGRHADLVGGKAIAMDEHDRNALHAFGMGTGQGGAHHGFLKGVKGFAAGGKAFGHLHHLLIEHRRQNDSAGEQVGPLLGTDAQRIGKPLRDQQQRPLSFAFEERVGGNRCSHPHRFHHARGQRVPRRYAQNPANTGEGRVGIMGRIVQQQFGGVNPPVGGAGHHIGERSAAIDPEMPGHGGFQRRQALTFTGSRKVKICRRLRNRSI
ncbi:MAG: hypothetical protein FD149_1703 [Rhodospirillaceae bacterium]|nr:MAG: hypothetical protein FD149_1703 [Rhodospirillaceae bacterium]